MSQLADIARALVAPKKGILAADESSGTIEKRFKSIDLASTEENRRAYRELLFTTAGVEQFISGVILFDETIRQKAKDGVPFADAAREAGHPAGHQGRQGHQAAPVLEAGEDHRGPRRPARADRGVPRPRRPLREVARGDRDRRRDPERHLHRDQRPRARPLRGPLRRGRAGSDRRARGPDGRRAHDRALLPGDRAHAARGLPPLTSSACRSSRRCSSRTWCSRARAARSRRACARWPSRRCAASATPCRRRCRASCSCRAARATSSPPPT